MKHKLYNRLLSLALAVGLVVGMLPGAAAVSVTEGSAGQPVTLVNGDQVSFTLPVKLYGDDGTDLSSAKTVNIPIVDGQTVQLPGEYTQGIGTISSGDKTYNYDYVAAGFNGERIDQLQAGLISTNTDDGVVIDSGGGIGDSWRILKYTTTYTYAVWYGNKPNSATSANVIATRSYTEEYKQRQKRFFGWYNDGDPYDYKTNPLQEQVDKKTIHFMYDKDGTLVPVKELTRDKIVTLNDGGTYDLTLTVSGAAGSITNPQKMDILFIFDRSNSMNNSSRLRYVKTAAKSLVNTLQDNKAIDARYSIVTFSSYSDHYGGQESDAECYLEWSEWEETGNYWNPSNNIADSIDRISTRGGTNYQAGIRKGITQLNSCRPDSQKVVVFLTDGLPTFRIGGGNGRDDEDRRNIGAAVQEIEKMNADAFYAIGVGNDFNNQSSAPVQNLNELCKNVNATQTGLYTAGDSGSSSDLEEIFQNIAGDAVSILCSNVTVTDTLSENVEIVTGGSGSGTPTSDDFTITVVGEDGQTVKTGQGSVTVDGATITASYNQETRQIVLDFPDDYQLKKGYTYKVTTKIQATEAAYEAYRNNENSYPDNGDQGTGTHAGQLGLYTNNKAIVDYTYNGKNYSAEYPMPVIQLDPGTLTITKQITGDLTEEQIAALKDSIKFEVELNGVKTSYPLSSFTEQNNNYYTMSIGGLSPNTQYTVTETGAELPGYILTQTPDDGKITGTVAKGGTATAAFTNKYTPDTGSLTITKTVVGLDSTALAELKDEISFVVKDNSGEIVATIKKGSEGWDTAWSENKFSYTLKNLPTGTYTVTESGYNDITNYIWQPGDITATGTVVYNADGTTAALTNTYTPADGYLTINKVIEGIPFNDGRDTFTFKVTAQSGKDAGKVWYFTIKGAGTVVNKKLPVGDYKVEELSNINYTCAISVQEIAISNGNTATNPATVTFTNTPDKTHIPTDGGGVKNVAEIKEGQITWKQEPENDEKPTPEPTHE